MDLTPLAPALSSQLQIIDTPGLPATINVVAATAPPRVRFLSRSWFAAPLGAAADRVTRTLIARRFGSRPIIALPFRRGRGGVREVPGAYWPFRSFPVAADLLDAEMLALLRHRTTRRALGLAWRLGPVPEDDPALSAIERTARAGGWHVYRRRISSAFVLDFDRVAANGAWPRNSTKRKNRFHEKHLASHGALEWTIHRGADWTPALIEDLGAVERKSWHGRSSDAKFLESGHRATWEALAQDPAQAERMSVALLRIDGAPAAFSFDMDVGDTKYAIANSYDPAFAKHSPGKCLYYRNLEAARERGTRRVDWGAGDSGYKETLGAIAEQEIVDCLIVRGWLAWLFGPFIRRAWAKSGQQG